MAGRDGLAVFVTSHGFGHLNRTVAVLNLLPPTLPITIYCHSNLFEHWHERLTRPAQFRAHVSDIGALNPIGDSARTDGTGTLRVAAQVHAEAVARLDEDVDALVQHRAAAVLCDAPAVPLLAAKMAGIPGYLLANFTWADIYAPHARTAGIEAKRFVAELREAYRQASLVFRTEPALEMKHCGKVEEVGMVVSAGRRRGAELRKTLGLGHRDKLIYFYVGRYGQVNLGWDRLAKMEGIHFVGFHGTPVGPIPNYHVVDPKQWTGADLAASTDVMVAKAGYGTVCDAMASGTPLIYPPRRGFAEHRALDKALKQWGGGIPASSRQFAELRLEPLLNKAFSTRPGPVPFRLDGADHVANRLIEVCSRA